MGALALPLALAASVFFQVRAGQAAEVEIKIAESAEKSKARGLEIESRRRLVEALSNQNAIRGAQGMGVGFGAVAAVTAGDASRAAFDRATIRGNSLARLRQFKARRRLIRRERDRARERELEQAREIEKAYHELREAKNRLVQQEKMASLVHVGGSL